VSHALPADGEAPPEPISARAFKNEVRAWAQRIGVEPAEVHLRPMRRKWASCSSRGRLTFDTALLAQNSVLRDEVVVHELLHLKVPNHGALFRSLTRAYLGDTLGGLSEQESLAHLTRFKC